MAPTVLTLLISILAATALAQRDLPLPVEDEIGHQNLPRSWPVYSYSPDVNSYMIGRGTYVPSSSAAYVPRSSSYVPGAASSYSYGAGPSSNPQPRPRPGANPAPSQQAGNGNGIEDGEENRRGGQSGTNAAAGGMRVSVGCLVGLGVLMGVVAVVL